MAFQPSKIYFFSDSVRRNILDDYVIGKKLGSGVNSTLRVLVNRITGEELAVKIMDKGVDRWGRPTDIKQSKVSDLKSVDDPNLCRIFEIYETDDRIYICKELLKGGEVFDRIVNMYPDGYSEKVVSTIISKVSRTLMKMHSRGMILGRFKDSTLIYNSDGNDGVVKITDYGMDEVFRFFQPSNLMRVTSESTGFTAPEKLLNQGWDGAGDMWGLGVTLYILLCGFPPFYSENTPELFDQIIEGNYEFPLPYWENVSKQAKDLVKKLLVVKPHERYRPSQVLKHPFITGNTDTTERKSVLEELKKYNAKRKFTVNFESVLKAKKFVKKLQTRGLQDGIINKK